MAQLHSPWIVRALLRWRKRIAIVGEDSS